MEFHFLGFYIQLMKVLINEFNPCNVIFITELPTVIHDKWKFVLQICTTNRQIQSVINILLIVLIVMCLCLFDINYTSTLHIQITSHYSCTISFLLYQHAFYCFHLLYLLGLLLYSPYFSFIAFHVKTTWCV